MPTFDVVVSAENNPFMVWQTMLFHFSCVTHLGQVPIVVVHKDAEPLLLGFEQIARTGGIVQTAPNYRKHGGVNYPPRNTAATLRFVESNADYIVLCDPDMIFLGPPRWPGAALRRRKITFDRLSYLDPDAAVHQPVLDDVCRRAGVAPERLRNPVLNGGVPHVIPARLREPLSREWLEIMALFPNMAPWPVEQAAPLCRECHIGEQKDWLATMWAIVLAMHRLGLQAIVTDWCLTNFEGGQRLPRARPDGPTMIHYCYGDAGFDKRRFDTREAAETGVWNLPDGDRTITGTIRRQLREAAAFYRRAGARYAGQ